MLSNEVVVVLCTVVLLGMVVVVLCTVVLLVVVLCTVVLLKVVVLSTVVLVQMASASTVQLATGPAQSLHARAQIPSAHHDSPATQGLHTRVAALEHMGYRY